MKIHYINLKRRPDRNAHFLKLNSMVADFQRLDAVDGKSLRVEDLLTLKIIQEPLQAYSAGGIGCAMSHKKVWETAIASTTPITVAEDDAIFNKRFIEKAVLVMHRLPADWDIILWGWNFDSILHVELIEGIRQSILHFDANSLEEKVQEFQDKNYEVIPLRLHCAFGTVSYSISARGARQLLAGCFPLKNEMISIAGLKRSLVNFSIDAIMNKHYPLLNAFVAFPPLVWTENDKATSDTSRLVNR